MTMGPTMTDKPILFSAPMVKVLLDGSKTQTRRLISPIKTSKLQPGDVVVSWPGDAFIRTCETFRPQYKVGDRLWVKEAGWLYGQWEEIGLTKTGNKRRHFNILNKSVRHQKPENIAWWPVNGMLAPAGYSWRTGMYMPRWTSRLTLTVTDVRVQRLQDIDRDDAMAEGIVQTWGDFMGNPPEWAVNSINQHSDASGSHIYDNRTSAENYRELWAHLHGRESWDTNPWVVAISFTVDHRNIDAVKL